jgi:hypothetical protein
MYCSGVLTSVVCSLQVVNMFDKAQKEQMALADKKCMEEADKAKILEVPTACPQEVQLDRQLMRLPWLGAVVEDKTKILELTIERCPPTGFSRLGACSDVAL